MAENRWTHDGRKLTWTEIEVQEPLRSWLRERLPN